MIVAVVLAAGAGSRFDGPVHKLLAPVDGVPVVRRAVDAAVAAGIGPVVVVTGPTPLDGALAEPVAAGGVTLVDNPAAAAGQAGSLQAGVRAAADLGASAVVVGLGDMPWVGPEPWRAVAGAPGDDDGAADEVVVVAGYRVPGGGATGSGDLLPRPPVRIPRARWADLPTDGDEGARVLLRARPELVRVVAVDGDPGDVDTRPDLRGPGT